MSTHRYYNINDPDAPKDSSSAPLPNGFVRVNTFDAYKTLRERELALHRLLCEVISMHNGLASIQPTATATAKPSAGASDNANALPSAAGDEVGQHQPITVPAPAPLTRAQQRLLEDLRDMCAIPEAATAAELMVAATDPTVQRVAGAGVARARCVYYDGVEDVRLDQPVYVSVAGLTNGGVGPRDDGGRVAVSTAASSAGLLLAGGGAVRPSSPNPPSSASASGAAAAAASAAALLAADPSRLYLSDLAVVEKEIKGLIKEVLSEGTSDTRRVAVHALLKEKRSLLLGLKAQLTGSSS